MSVVAFSADEIEAVRAALAVVDEALTQALSGDGETGDRTGVDASLRAAREVLATTDEDLRRALLLRTEDPPVQP